MWYQLPPDTSLPVIVLTYQELLREGRVPNPVPVYIDEGPLEDAEDWTLGDRYDTYHEEFPHVHVNFSKEILLQYCESWIKRDIQRQFLEDLGIPSAWMREALVRILSCVCPLFINLLGYFLSGPDLNLQVTSECYMCIYCLRKHLTMTYSC